MVQSKPSGLSYNVKIWNLQSEDLGLSPSSAMLQLHDFLQALGVSFVFSSTIHFRSCFSFSYFSSFQEAQCGG